MELHEFYLEFAKVKKDLEGRFYRICAGPLMKESQRTTLAHSNNYYARNPENMTGAIGFLDILFRDDIMEILEFGIEPEYRGRLQYAMTLYKRAEEIARERGFPSIRIPTPDNPEIRKVAVRYDYEEKGGYLVKNLIEARLANELPDRLPN